MTNVSFDLDREEDLGNLDSMSYLDLPDPEYYPRILFNEQNRNGIASRYGLDPEDIASAEYSNLSFPGFLSRTRLYRVTFRDSEKRNLPLEILLKVAHPGFTNTDISRRHHEELESSMVYQYNQMRFWNAIGLPAPLVFDLSKGEHRGVVHYYLAMEFWDGNTHDLNVLALDQYARNTTSGGKNQQDFVESEKDNIILSSLEAIRRFHVVGTKEARTRRIDVFTPHDVHRYFVEDRGALYFDKYLRLKLEVGASDIEETLHSFCQVLIPLLEPFSVVEKYRYSQGDEYLHHFQYRQHNNGHRVTGIFDADHAMMTRPEYSLAKLLTSHLLDLSLEQELEYVKSTFFSSDAPQGERYLGLGPTRDSMRDYVLISLATRLFDMGKRASHALREDHANARIVTGLTFKPHKTTFPLKEYVPPSVRYPIINDSISVQTRALQDRLDRTERGELGGILHSRDVEHVKGLHNFLARNNLL